MINRHLFLTGYRAVGKSTVARLLGDRLDAPVCDLDQMITDSEGRSIKAIFERGGESLFRQIESDNLQRVIEREPSIISLGGGTIIDPLNRDRIRRGGLAVWLTASTPIIAARIAADSGSAENRPSLTDEGLIEEIDAVLRKRRSWYEEVADLRIDTDHRDSVQIADEIVAWWRSREAD